MIDLPPDAPAAADGLICGDCGGTVATDGRCAKCGAEYQPQKWSGLRDVVTADGKRAYVAVGEEEATIGPMEIVARVFERPITDLAKRVDFERRLMPPAPNATGKVQIDIRAHRLAVINKVTPEMLLAVVGTLIATSATAAEAVARIRAEVAGWTFETSTGERG